MKNLFRQEVYDAQKTEVAGDILLLQPVRLYAVGLLLLLIFIVAVTFLAQGSYASKETATGYIEPSKAIAKVFAQSEGFYSQTWVEPGQHVVKGEPLFAVTPSTITSGGSKIEAKLLDELKTQRQLLDNRIATDAKRRENKQLELSNTLDSLQTTLKAQQAALHIAKQMANLAEQEHAYYQKLYDNRHLSTLEFTRSKRALLESKLDIERKAASLSESQSAIKQVQLQLNNLSEEFDDQLATIKQQRSTINMQLTEARKRAGYTVHAPASGIVSNMLARVGMSIDTTQPALALVPEDIKFSAKLYVTSKAIGFIRKGQPLKLRIDAFAFEKFGVQHGTIAYVSANTIMASGNNKPMYLVKATLDKQTVTAYGNEVSLVPGMSVDAEIVIEQRSLLQWLFAPLYALGGHS